MIPDSWRPRPLAVRPRERVRDGRALPIRSCLDRKSEAEREADVALALRTGAAGPRAARKLLCVSCGHAITSDQCRCESGGGHEHLFTNPHGIQFLIGCFTVAPGCQHYGASTREDSWFAGYAWQIALCAACGLHLGWRYQGAGPEFHGLILSRLTAGRGAPGGRA